MPLTLIHTLTLSLTPLTHSLAHTLSHHTLSHTTHHTPGMQALPAGHREGHLWLVLGVSQWGEVHLQTRPAPGLRPQEDAEGSGGPAAPGEHHTGGTGREGGEGVCVCVWAISMPIT